MGLLDGQAAIVTAGAGAGIGQAVARIFLEEGAQVLVTDAHPRRVQEVAEALSKDFGREVPAMEVDVRNVDQVRAMVDAALDRFGRIDVLFNNAGINKLSPVWEMDDETWRLVIDVNLTGTFNCTRAVLPHMIRRRSGKIINLSGGGAVGPFPRFSAYATSKAAVVRFTETVAEEVRAHNVQVNAIAPGAVNTRLLDQVLEAGERAGADFLEKSRAQQASGGTSPAVGAELALHLASSRGDGITGKLLSAVWDDWKRLGEASPMPAALYTLRRIDGRHFIEGPQA